MIEIRLARGRWTYDSDKPLGPPGGFGSVFNGFSPSGESVAVKRLHLSAREAAHRELAIAQELFDHKWKHVVPILDAGQDAESDAYFVVMPIANHSLQDFVETRGPVSEGDAVAILLEVALGLGELRQIVHRDLKPGNVLYLDGSWRISDFGIAKFVEDSTSTQTLKECLTAQFAAPEQWRHERATTATDVYALGCIAHSLLTGSPPFAGTTEELRECHLHASPGDVPASPRLRMLVRMMLRKEMPARPSLARIAAVFQSCLASPLDEAQSDPDIDRLATAAAEHERRIADVEAQIALRKTAQAKRASLAADARATLDSIFAELTECILSAVPTAAVSRDSPIGVRVGSGLLDLVIGASGSVLPEDAFPMSKWDVICDGILTVTQLSPLVKRSANVWYTNKSDPEADYRWYEVGYGGNPLTSTRFEFEPAAANIQQADRAHAPGMDIFQVSYGPTAIDYEDTAAFCRRWIRILAAACEGTLGDLPRSLP